MHRHFLTSSLILFSMCLQINGVNAVSGSGCQRTIDVKQQEFGVVYEYFHDGNDAACSYEFHGEEEHRVMLAVNHIGLLPKQPGEGQCNPQLTITDVSTEGKETVVTTICDDKDARVKGGFVSSSNVAKVTFRGPSDNGILLLQYWFVKDVILIQKESEPIQAQSTVSPVIYKPDLTGFTSGCSESRSEFLRAGIEVQCDGVDLFRPLQCSEWGSGINLARCICVDKVTGETNGLKPPYCLEPPEGFQTRCAQELAEVRLAIALKETLYIYGDLLPPTCDSSGNYVELQCRFPYGESCRCVDRFTGNVTNFAPPLCELSLPTEEPLSTNLPSTTQRGDSAPDCFVFLCTLFCESGAYAIDDDGCQICVCEPYVNITIEACPEARSRTINETLEQWQLDEPSPPYSWVPDCDYNLYKQKQSNHLAGYFCVDQQTGQPSGTELPACDIYKKCVNDRIMGFSKALRKAGYKKTSKEVKNFLIDTNANEVRSFWNLMSDEEQGNIFAKSSIFVASCNAYGDFNALQCNYATGNCWCVDIIGAQIEGSRRSITQQMPDCMQYIRQPDPGPVYLEDMYDFSFELNDNWAIHSTFDHFLIPRNDDIYYYWTKDGVPVPLIGSKPGKYSLNTWEGDDEQLTIGLGIYDSTEDDAGSYMCHLVKSSTGYFYSSPPANAKVSRDYTDYNDDYEYVYGACNIMSCDKVCAYGYIYINSCAVCECRQQANVLPYQLFENIKVDIATSFGTNNGRCEAKRQWIMKNIKARNLTADQEALGKIDIPPQCDSNGNFATVQNMLYVGRVCVDVMTGLPSGRMLPDCIELNQCTKDNILGMKSHLNAFLNDQAATDDVISNISSVNSLRQQEFMFNEAFADAPNYILIDEDGPGLLPVGMCHQETGLYYGTLCNFKSSRECWCVNFYGDEIESSRVGVNDTKQYCGTSIPYVEPEIELYTPANQTEFVVVKINSTVELLCSTTATSVDTYVTWDTPRGYLEKINIADKRIEMIGDGIIDFTLRITNVNYSDQGTYVCELYTYLSGYDGIIFYTIILTNIGF